MLENNTAPDTHAYQTFNPGLILADNSSQKTLSAVMSDNLCKKPADQTFKIQSDDFQENWNCSSA